jgi:cytoskeletal protein CcmA (bactofilin family)
MMYETNKPDLNLAGMGGAVGGSYRNVKMEGIGKVDGSLVCETFTQNGIGTVIGSITCFGLCDMHGKLKVEGSIDARELILEGQVRVNGRLQGEVVKLTGMLTVHGDCEADWLQVEGGFTIDGLLSADNMEIRLQARGQVREIGGERIRVTLTRRSNWGRLLGWAVPALQPHLNVQTVEGGDIELTDTIAEVVRGDRVVIGPGCRIDHVEYTQELTVHPTASVGTAAKR